MQFDQKAFAYKNSPQHSSFLKPGSIEHVT